ncbi:galaxin-like [Saccostrea echinata]|uniref:galaxin-like n=1 Tax=Saccostrea echinata TaxID=191078 RepID=UPI002A8063D4|nr:galaxin-like [Saccostrea echinata]
MPTVCLMSKKRNTQCCGNQLISTKNGCCNETTPFNKTISACEKKQIVPRFHDFCNGILYDKRKQICCDESKLYNKSSFDKHIRCCGESLFDNRREQCCERADITKVQPTTGHCCGTGLYNSSNEICCHNNVYDSSNGTIQCCGNGSFDKRHQTCCHGIVHNIKHVSDPKCCGKDVYSTASHLCCSGDQIIKKNASDHDQCCLRNSEFYSCKHQPRRPSIFCGYQRYNSQTDLCCNNQVHKGAKETGRECCHPGKKDYDPRNEKCCHGLVKSIAESCSEQSDTPSSSTQSSICSIISQKWTTWNMRKSVNIGSLDICRRNGYVIKVHHIKCFNSTKELSPRMILTGTAKQNFYNATDALSKRKIIKIDLPCSCNNHYKLRKKRILLVTDIDLKVPHRTFHLGDSDIILPYKKKVLKDVKKRRKSAVCEPQNCVKNRSRYPSR